MHVILSYKALYVVSITRHNAEEGAAVVVVIVETNTQVAYIGTCVLAFIMVWQYHDSIIGRRDIGKGATLFTRIVLILKMKNVPRLFRIELVVVGCGTSA